MRQFISFFFGLLLLGSTIALAQDNTAELTADELYEKARIAAFEEENYSKAREYAYQALEKTPDYHGIRIFVARLYSWQENYDKAREELQYVLDHDPENRRAYLAFSEIENMVENYDKAIQFLNKALEYHPDDKELLLKKASLLYNSEKYERSEEVYEAVLNRHPDNVQARDGLRAVQKKLMKYRATLSYRHDQFTEIFDPWRFTEIGLSRETPYGPVIGHVEYAQRFSKTGTQFNLDLYPSITEGLYAYLSGAYSGSSIYPRYRFGVTLYKSLPAAFEMGAGFRYLDFVSRQIDIYTASLSKYWGSYFIMASSYFVPLSDENLGSFTGTVRRYLGDEDTYMSLTGGYGSTSTEIEFAQDIQISDSWSLGVQAQYPLSAKVILAGIVEYNSDDFEHENFVRERFSFNMRLSYRF